MKILFIICICALNVLSLQYKHKHRHRHQSRSEFETLKKYLNDPDLHSCFEKGAPPNIYEKCHMKSGRVARMMGHKDSFSPAEPVTIVSRNMFAEVNIHDLIIYADQNKKMKIYQNGLSELKRIIWPRSFRQEGYEVNCFQLDFESKDCQPTIKVEEEQLEPSDKIAIGFCFPDQNQMKEWMDAIIEFRDGCQNEKNAELMKRNDQKLVIDTLNKMQGYNQLDYIQGQINNLITQAVSLKRSLEVIEKNKDKITAFHQLNKMGDSGIKTQMEIDKKENAMIGQPESCPESNHAKGKNQDKPCKKPLQDLNQVISEKDISYIDIDQDQDLSEQDKIKKKGERLQEWKNIQDKITPKRLNQMKKGSMKEKLQPIKQLLQQLLKMQSHKKTSLKNRRRRR